MSEFYEGDVGDVEQPVGPLEADLAEEGYDREQLDEWAQEVYGLDSWSDVEQQWADDQAAELERVRQEGIEAMASSYANQRLGQLTRSIVEQGGPGLEEIHLPALHDVAHGLTNNAEWLREHPGLEGEPLIAQALRDGLLALSVEQAPDENEALRRRAIRMQARGGG